MKNMVIAMRLNTNPGGSGADYFGTELKFKLELPDGAAGILFAFKTKTAARKYYGKNVELSEIQFKEGE